MIEPGYPLAPAAPAVRLSIVSTLYKSETMLPEFIRRCAAVMDSVVGGAELILVDDGSPDRSLEVARVHLQGDPRIRIVELSRNFGHHAAILEGLAHARGELVFFVDSDLEEDPALAREFLDVMRHSGADVVFGVHRHEVGSPMRRFTGRMFWRVFNMLSDTKTELNICNVRLMTQKYVSALLSMPERNVFLGGMFAWPGFIQVPVAIERRMREGHSTYSLSRRLTLMIDSVVSFSAKPLHLVFWMGCLISLLAVAVALVYLTWKVAEPTTVVSGFTALIISIWFLSGLIMASLGLVGLYVSYVYKEVKGRPRTIVRAVHERADAGHGTE